MTTQSPIGFEILLLKPLQTVTNQIYNSENYIYGSNGSCTIYSVKRFSDQEVFTIGDRISNDMIKGKITEFRITNGEIFVVTTWSGVGMSLGSIHRILTLPSKYQEGDPVRLDFYGTVFVTGWIHKVHFSKNTTTYDVEILTQHKGKSYNFRQYNIHSDFVFDRD